MNHEVSKSIIAQHVPLPLEVPLGAQAVRLIDGRIADQPPVRGGGRLEKPGRSLFGARAEAVLVPASSFSLTLSPAGLQSQEGLDLGLTLRLHLALVDAHSFVGSVLGARQQVTTADLEALLRDAVRGGLDRVLRRTSIVVLYDKRHQPGWLATAVEAGLTGEVNLLEKYGLRLEGVEASDLYCQVFEGQRQQRLRWYLAATEVQIAAEGRRTLDQVELDGLLAHLAVKGQLVAALERLGELHLREREARRKLDDGQGGERHQPGDVVAAPGAGQKLAERLGDPALDGLWRIFCPRCSGLTLQASCSRCGWQRPGTGEPRARPRLQTDARAERGNLHVAGGLLALTIDSGEVVLLERFDLKLRGRRPVEMEGQRFQPGAELAADESHIYVGAALAQSIGQGAPLLALRRNDLAVAWSQPTGGAQVSGPAVAGGLVLAASNDNQTWAVDAASGQVAWQQPLTTIFSPRAPAADGELVVFPSRSSRIEARDLAGGRLRWFYQAAAGSLINTPLLAGQRVYVAGGDGSLICLDSASGKAIWRCPTECRQGLTTQPLLAGSLILVGSRDHRLHAVDLDGRLVWTYQIDKPIASRPLVVEDVVYLGGLDRALHALDLATGRPLWPQPLALGERVYADLASDGAQVIVLGHKGTLWTVPLHLAPLQPGAAYEAQGRFALAVAAHALAGDLLRAAALCSEALHLPAAAAQLYERAQQSVPAAAAYEQAGLWDAAERVYRQAGQTAAAASAAEQAGRLRDAARGYEEAGRWADAARVYEQIGEHAQAGELYRRAGDGASALRCFERLGDHANMAEELFRQGRLAEAAASYAAAGELARAVDLYLQQGLRAEAAKASEHAGDLVQAARLWEQEGDTARAVALYQRDGADASLAAALLLCQRSGAWRQEIEVLAALGHDQRAGQRALERAQQRERDTEGKARDELAELFGLAAQHFRTAGLDESEEPLWGCDRKIRYYKNQPDLRVAPQPDARPFVVDQVNVLQVLVENVGLGKAEYVRIRLEPALSALVGDLADQCSAISNRAGRWRPNFNVVPKRPGRVRLRCLVEYKDDKGHAYQLSQYWEIEVQDKSQPGNQVIYVQQGGAFYQSGRDTNIVQGDQLQGEAQKGDRVTIDRRRVGQESGDGPPRCTQCNTILAAGAAFCDQCGHPAGA